MEKICEKDDGIHCEDKDEKYLKAVINIIKVAFGDDGDGGDEGAIIPTRCFFMGQKCLWGKVILTFTAYLLFSSSFIL